MKKCHVLVSSLALFVGAASCSQSNPDSPGTGGHAGNTTQGTGGVSTGGTGGNTQGTGGDTSPGSGGNVGTGGSTITGSGGEVTGGTGGTPGGTGGRASGTGGQGGSGTAGVTGIGGRGGAGTGGVTGTGGAGTAGSGAIDINTLVPGFDGYYWEVTPSGNTALDGTNYPFGPAAGGCPTSASYDTRGNISIKPALNVHGAAGQKYTLNINVRGVVGTRCYTGGTPGSTATPVSSGPNNTWYAGGTQYNDSIYNTLEVRVAPKVGGQANQVNTAYDVYYVNSFPRTPNWCQKEATYEARFNASFPVMGGGTITLVVHDSNCRTLANCGPVENQSTCNTAASRVIDMSGVSPAPMNFNQPRTGSLGGNTYQLQWVWFDVMSVQ